MMFEDVWNESDVIELVKLTDNEIVQYNTVYGIYISTLFTENMMIRIYSETTYSINDLELIKNMISDKSPDITMYDIDEGVAVSIYKLNDEEIEIWEFVEE